MAVPSAVLRQREKLEKELGINRDGTPVTPEVPDAPAVASVTTEPATAQQPSTPTQPESVVTDASRIAELEHLLRTRDGQTSAATKEANEARARADAVAMQVKALEEAVAELRQQKETAEARLAAKAADASMPSLDDVGDLSPKELETFGADSVSFVEKLSKKELLRYIKPVVEKMAALEARLARLSDLDKLPQLEKAVTRSQEEAARAKETEFVRKEVLSHFPDFEKTRVSQEWKDYLATDLPELGIKIGHQLHQYRMMFNAQGIRAVIGAFYDQHKQKPSLASLAVPSKTATEGTPAVKPKLKASEYKSKLREFINRALPKAEWDTYKAEFNAAMQEGRVEMDASL